ncbi:MAG TPA: M3 family metallopeptidase [Acidobacteriaceae bacterium]
MTPLSSAPLSSALAYPWNPTGTGSVDPEALSAWVEDRLQRHRDAVARVTTGASRTLDATLRAYDDAVAELATVGSLTGLLHSVYPEKPVRDKSQDLLQTIAQAGVELSLNREVYQALAAIDATAADPASKHYLDRTLLQYRLAGVDKDDATRARIRELSDQATLHGLNFGRNVQEGGNTVTLSDPAELDGLPPDFLEAHKPGDDGKIVLTTDFPDYLPVMTFARSADLRRRMFLAYNTRAFPANRQVLLDLLKVRQEVATILGFPHWADLATADQMMESAANMQAFLDDLDKASKAGAEKEYSMLLDFAQKAEPGLTQIDGASRTFWLEQYRRSAFDFDSQSVRPYFPYDRVEPGVLATAEKLFQVTFRRIDSPDVWHPSVSAWEVWDRTELAGRFYLDMHPREGKDKWFSAHPLVPGIRGRQLPEAALICNFPEPKEGNPGLLQYSDVVTFFHEFGHLMHALLGGRQAWAGISGIATEGDFVEVPSQMLEEFFRDPRLLATFAHHYQTDEPIPAELVLRMNRAGAFGRADWVRTQLFYTTCSLQTHCVDPAALDLDVLFRSLYERFLPYAFIEGNRMYASFTHLVGYSSNYYTYLYDKVIALDFFSQFPRNARVDSPVAMHYRQTVLEPGGSQPGRDIVQHFLGRSQSSDAFTQWMNEEFQPMTAAYE